MDKDAIRRTAVVCWSAEDDCYVVSSFMLDSVLGAGDTENEAFREFDDILSDAYEAYCRGRLKHEKPGRPSKNTIALNVDVQPDTKEQIKDLATTIGCSQGEAIDFLVSCYQAYESRKSVASNMVAESRSKYQTKTSHSKNDFESRLSRIESVLFTQSGKLKEGKKRK